MEKLFYMTEIRIGKVIEQNSDNEFLIYYFYHNDGYCMIEKNKIKGILTDDLLTGNYDGEILFLTLLYNHFYITEDRYFFKDIYKYQLSVSISSDELDSKINFINQINEKDYLYFEISFVSKVDDIETKDEIKNSLHEAGLI